jgi:hypothetical protein
MREDFTPNPDCKIRVGNKEAKEIDEAHHVKQNKGNNGNKLLQDQFISGHN